MITRFLRVVPDCFEELKGRAPVCIENVGLIGTVSFSILNHWVSKRRGQVVMVSPGPSASGHVSTI